MAKIGCKTSWCKEKSVKGSEYCRKCKMERESIFLHKKIMFMFARTRAAIEKKR